MLGLSAKRSYIRLDARYVLIMDVCEDSDPEKLNMVAGVVDSSNSVAGQCNITALSCKQPELGAERSGVWVGIVEEKDNFDNLDDQPGKCRNLGR